LIADILTPVCDRESAVLYAAGRPDCFAALGEPLFLGTEMGYTEVRKAKTWRFDVAAAELGPFTRITFATNSRVRAVNTRRALCWNADRSGPPND
jgi:hypothetical protein